jgi:hypothetical protein
MVAGNSSPLRKMWTNLNPQKLEVFTSMKLLPYTLEVSLAEYSAASLSTKTNAMMAPDTIRARESVTLATAINTINVFISFLLRNYWRKRPLTPSHYLYQNNYLVLAKKD